MSETKTTTEQSTEKSTTDDPPTEDQLNEWRADFKDFAVDGVITKGDLEKYLQRKNKNPKEKDIDDLVGMLNCADMDGDGQINEDEFIKIQIAASKMNFYKSNIQDELVEALKVFDENNDGTISEDELRKILQDYKDDMLEDVMNSAGRDENGNIPIEKLAEHLTHIL